MNIFDKMAKQYDREDRVKIANIVVKEIEKELIDTYDKIAIDYGCGTGLVGLKLVDKFKSILLIDSSEEMINVVNEKIEKMNLKNVKTEARNFSVDEQLNRKADVIILSLVLLHVPDISQILSSLYELLNEEGVLLIVDFDKNKNINHEKVHNGFTHEELTNKTKSIGFIDIDIRTFYHGKNVFMNQDASMFIFRGKK